MLTPTETKLVQWVAYGKTAGEIAEIEGMSEHTVRCHLLHSKEKLQVYKEGALVYAALKLGIIE